MLYRNLQTVVLSQDSLLVLLQRFDRLLESMRLWSNSFESRSDFFLEFSRFGSDMIETLGH